MKFETMTPKGNSIVLFIFDRLFYRDEETCFHTGKMCILCKSKGFPDLYNKYFVPSTADFSDSSGESWFDPYRLSRNIRMLDSYFVASETEGTKPNFVVQGL